MELKQVIVVRKDLKMGPGKVAAQSAHASVEAVEKTNLKFPEYVADWKNSGSEKVVLKVESRRELLELFQKMKRKFPCTLITDAGRTQIKAGTITCFACGPAPEKELDAFIKDLKLL